MKQKTSLKKTRKKTSSLLYPSIVSSVLQVGHQVHAQTPCELHTGQRFSIAQCTFEHCCNVGWQAIPLTCTVDALDPRTMRHLGDQRHRIAWKQPHTTCEKKGKQVAKPLCLKWGNLMTSPPTIWSVLAFGKRTPLPTGWTAGRHSEGQMFCQVLGAQDHVSSKHRVDLNVTHLAQRFPGGMVREKISANEWS